MPITSHHQHLFLLLSFVLLSIAACHLPQTPPAQEKFFCATDKDCASPATCVRSVCQTQASQNPCSDDVDVERPCIPPSTEAHILGETRLEAPKSEDDDNDAASPFEPKTSPTERPHTLSGREAEQERNFDLATPDAVEPTLPDEERRHVEIKLEPASEPSSLPDSPRDPNLTCSHGTTQPCYPPQTEGCSISQQTCRGRCKLGQQTCENGKWGSCKGAITPEAEKCDNLDWDCDGKFGNENGSRICQGSP